VRRIGKGATAVVAAAGELTLRPAWADHGVFGGSCRYEPSVGNRDHRFSAGYPSFKAEGAVFWAGNIRPVPPETNCDLDKSAPVARDRYQESRRTIGIGGVGVCERGTLRPVHGTRHAIATA
jgi:hypothetical protein